MIAPATSPAAPVILGVGLCVALMVGAGAWSWANRDHAHARRTAENVALTVATVLILAALWAALLQPWPRR